MIKSRVIFNGAEVNVYFTYDEGQVGSCDSYGAKYEPDYPFSIDIDEVFYQGVNIMPILNDDDLAEIESLVTEQAKKEYDGE
jgi:hypothetical protein